MLAEMTDKHEAPTVPGPPRYLTAPRQVWEPELLMDMRLGLGLTQADLADRVGVTPRTISRWECRHNRPTGACARIVDELYAAWQEGRNG